MRQSTVLAFCAAAAIAASPALAGAPDQRVNFTVAGGATFPLSAAGDRLNTGFNTSFGVTFKPISSASSSSRCSTR